MLPLQKLKLSHTISEALHYTRISAPENEAPYAEITNGYVLIRIPLPALFGDESEAIAESVRAVSPDASQALFLIDSWKAGKFHSAFSIRLLGSEQDKFTLKATDKKGNVTGEMPVFGVYPGSPVQPRFPNTDAVIPSEEKLLGAEPINDIAFSMGYVNNIREILKHERFKFRFTGQNSIIELIPIFGSETPTAIADAKAWAMPIKTLK